MALLKDRFDALLEKATSGDTNSQYKLAQWLSKGHLVEKNIDAAKYWAFKAVDGGLIKAGSFLDKLIDGA